MRDIKQMQRHSAKCDSYARVKGRRVEWKKVKIKESPSQHTHMGPYWGSYGKNYGTLMGYPARAHLGDDNGISLGPKWDFSGHPYGPQKFPKRTNSHMGPNWVCPCISHIYIYIYIYICIIYKFILLMLFLFIV